LKTSLAGGIEPSRHAGPYRTQPRHRRGLTVTSTPFDGRPHPSCSPAHPAKCCQWPSNDDVPAPYQGAKQAAALADHQAHGPITAALRPCWHHGPEGGGASEWRSLAREVTGTLPARVRVHSPAQMAAGSPPSHPPHHDLSSCRLQHGYRGDGLAISAACR
jgi:hypothetical protein